MAKYDKTGSGDSPLLVIVRGDEWGFPEWRPNFIRRGRRSARRRASRAVPFLANRSHTRAALPWQVNAINPEGFFGDMLSGPVARIGVAERAARFHDSRAALTARMNPVLRTRSPSPVHRADGEATCPFLRSKRGGGWTLVTDTGVGFERAEPATRLGEHSMPRKPPNNSPQLVTQHSEVMYPMVAQPIPLNSVESA